MPVTNLKELPIEEAEFSVLDFETTGTSSKNNRVIEVGIVKIKKLQIADKFQSLINPGIDIPFFITNLTSISTADVSDAPAFEQIAEDITGFIGDSVLTAHNLSFDHSFLNKELIRAGYSSIENPKLCTLKLARKLFPGLKSKSLGSVTNHLHIRHRNVHRALGDAMVTAKILIKMIKTLRSDYHIETAQELINFQGLPSGKSSFRIIKKKLADDFHFLPDHPGIYIFKNSKDKIIYIGKAKSLKNRVKNYFSNTAGRKSKKIVRAASKLEHRLTNTELTALITEAELIKIEKPPVNTMLKRYSQNYFIAVRYTSEYPDVKVSSRFDFNGDDYFGPYNNRDTANKLTEIIDRTFGLRECRDKELFKGRKCYLADIQRCLAPCVNNQKSKYENELSKVADFLSGHNQHALDRLLAKMKLLSEKMKYEEAAEVRDSINLLLAQLNKSSIVAEPINSSEVLIRVNENNRSDFILLINGKVFIKDYFLDPDSYFETALEDYYNGCIHLFPGIEEKDFEKIKITLSWLVKNRNKASLYYLKDFSSSAELYSSMAGYGNKS